MLPPVVLLLMLLSAIEGLRITIPRIPPFNPFPKGLPEYKLQSTLSIASEIEAEMRPLKTRSKTAMPAGAPPVVSRRRRSGYQHIDLSKGDQPATGGNPTDCKAHFVAGVKDYGVFTISPVPSESLQVFCMGGYTYLQRRNHGRLDFNRRFFEYKSGFGSATEEHWLGLENMHVMTRGKTCALKIIVAFDARHRDPQRLRGITVKSFSVAQGSGYEAKFEGLLTDFPHIIGVSALQGYHTKWLYPFATPDNFLGNDRYRCAARAKVGWWYVNCALADLNQNMGMMPNDFKGQGRCDYNNPVCAYIYPFILRETHMMVKCQ